MAKKEMGFQNNLNTFFNDDFISRLRQGETTTKYELIVKDDQATLITTIEQRVKIEGKEASPVSLIDSLASQMPVQRRRPREGIISKEEEKKKVKNETKDKSLQSSKETKGSSKTSENSKSSENTKPSRPRNTAKTPKNSKLKPRESLIDLLRNEEEIDLKQITKRLSEGEEAKESLSRSSFSSKEEILQEHIDVLKKVYTKDQAPVEFQDSEFYSKFTTENIQMKRQEYLSRITSLYIKHNKLQARDYVDFLGILRKMYNYLWFSSAGTLHLLFGRLDKAFIEAWQVYLLFNCDLEILMKGENVFYGYFRFKISSFN